MELEEARVASFAHEWGPERRRPSATAQVMHAPPAHHMLYKEA
jgi:hypothetical protein